MIRFLQECWCIHYTFFARFIAIFLWINDHDVFVFFIDKIFGEYLVGNMKKIWLNKQMFHMFSTKILMEFSIQSDSSLCWPLGIKRWIYGKTFGRNSFQRSHHKIFKWNLEHRSNNVICASIGIFGRSFWDFF